MLWLMGMFLILIWSLTLICFQHCIKALTRTFLVTKGAFGPQEVDPLFCARTTTLRDHSYLQPKTRSHPCVMEPSVMWLYGIGSNSTRIHLYKNIVNIPTKVTVLQVKLYKIKLNRGTEQQLSLLSSYAMEELLCNLDFWRSHCNVTLMSHY